MKKCIKRISIVIMFLLLGLILYPNSVNAKNVSSDFIKITDHSYTYTDEELAISEVHFSNGVLNGKMENLSDYYLSVQMTIDYYDENYNIVARSTKTEKPGKAKENYIMNIILYKDDFIENQNINDIKYFKINYYTVKGNKISKDNLTINEKENYNNIVLSKSGYYRNYDYVIDSYNVDIKVNENNTYDITETIGTYFNVSKHGIYRTIPLRNTVQRLDGTTDKNRAKISKLQVSDKYTTSKENGNYKIKIGSKNITLTGKKDYVISYNYNIGKDRSDSYDEVYFNIIGPEWDTVIGDITFTITMPKEFDKEKLGFSSGTIGSTNSSRISYTVDKNVIKGRYNGIITPGEALTFRIELPDGYFINAGYQIDMVTRLFFLVPLFGLIVAFLMWCKFGKDEQVIETVEFYPPEGYNSLEIGYLYKGRASNEDVTSLLVYLANKGYIKITEKEPNSIFSSFKITKLKSTMVIMITKGNFLKDYSKIIVRFQLCRIVKIKNILQRMN